MTENGNTEAGKRPGKRGLYAFRSDESGVISVMAAFSLLLVIAVAAVVLDAGAMLLARRSLQSATDAAALSAAQHLPGGAQSAAADVLSTNGYSTGTLQTVQTGTYTADESKPAASRFVAGGGQINAVRVTTQTTVAAYFASVLGLGNLNTVHATATATQSPAATFEAGTRLASLNNGLANQVLGGLLGTTLSLSLVDYQSLAGTQINALSFLNALASQINLTSTSTYGDLLASNVTVGQLFAAGINVLKTSGQASGSVSGSISALQQLSNQAPAGTTVNVGSIISAPAIADRSIGGIVSGSDGGATLDLYNVVAATARTAGAGNIINLTTGLTIPVVGSSIQARLVAGQGKQIATGPVGTSINTSQVRLTLDLQLANVSQSVAGLGTLVATSIDLPIYIEAASGTATIKAIPCQNSDMVTLTGTSSAVTLKYGTVTTGALSSFSSSPTVTPATIASVKLLSTAVAAISATGSVVVAGHGPEDHQFTQANVTAVTVQSVPSSNDGRLIADNGPGALRTSIALLPGVNLGIILQPLLNAALSPLLTLVTQQLLSALALLDAPVNSLLTTLGIQLGVLDMDVTQVQCGVPTLVN